MKKKKLIIVIIAFLLTIFRVNKVEALKYFLEGEGISSTVTSPACITRQYGRVIGFKITMKNHPYTIPVSEYFLVSNNNGDSIKHIQNQIVNKNGTYDDETLKDLITNYGSKNKDTSKILTFDDGVNTNEENSIAGAFKNNINDKVKSKITNSFLEEKELLDTDIINNVYFAIEPIYLFESCDYNLMIGNTSPQQVFIVGTTRTIINKILATNTTISGFYDRYGNPATKGKLSFDIKDGKSDDTYSSWLPASNIYNFMMNFVLTEGYDDYTGLGSFVPVLDTIKDNIDEGNLSDLINQFNSNNKLAFSLMIMTVKDLSPKCDYNNALEWENNKKYGPNAVNASGRNCCEDYKDKSDLCLDHPECCKPATYLFKGAKCSYIASENNASFKVNNSVDSWGNIFASIYSDGTGSGSSGNFLVSNLDDYAKLICKETISINYPGPINTIERFDNIGGHFIWPKNPSFSDDGLLKISSDVSCRVFLDVTGGDSYFNDTKILEIKNKAINDMNKYNLSANLSVEYDDSSYGKLSSLVPETNEKNILNITSSGEDGATNYEKLKNTTYTFSASRYYVIDNNGYRFISKKDGKYYKTITGQKIYDKLNQAVLPVDVSNFSEGKNNATIIINKIGGFKQINIKSIEGGKNNNYTCKYNFVPTSNCECPMDSKHAQLDLSKYLINNKKTCPEAQKEYCNGSLPPGGDSYVCPEDENTICHGCSYATSWAQLISEYMKKNGGTYETAEEKTKEQAISNVCYGKKKMKIIYRTISLNNPFLGKNGDNRTPGTNWNDNKLRDSKGRLYSRWYLNESGKETSNISGNDLYNTNIEPLYTIELTPSIIKKIREYNKNNSYDDFNLSCLDESTKCISSFLDSEIKVTGKCSNVTNKSDFNNCIQ